MKTSFSWNDPLLLEQQTSDDERAVRDAAHAYCQEMLAPRVLEAFRNEKTDTNIFRDRGELGLLGPTPSNTAALASTTSATASWRAKGSASTRAIAP